MRLVIDSNIFMASLVSNGFIRRIITEFSGELLFPEYIFEEIKKHKSELVEKSTLSELEFDILLSEIIKYVTIVKTDFVISFKDEADEIVKKIDSDDIQFFATSLAYDKCPIWSDDKKLKQQNKIKIISTKELADFLFGFGSQ